MRNAKVTFLGYALQVLAELLKKEKKENKKEKRFDWIAPGQDYGHQSPMNPHAISSDLPRS